MQGSAAAVVVVVALFSACTSSGDTDTTQDLESPLSGEQVTVEPGAREEFLALHAGSLEPGTATTFAYERFQDDEVVLTETQTEVTLADEQIVAAPRGLTYWRGTEMFSCTNFEGTKECRPPETVATYAERSAADVDSLTERTVPDSGDLTVGTAVGPEILGRPTRCFEVVPVDDASDNAADDVDPIAARTETCFDDDGAVLARVSIRPDVIESWTATAVDPATPEQIATLLEGYPLE
ncbi:MAG: hypothetical protein M5U31_04110 [Acidimicrobiia bacterium]|nr:hypothetical protein [Acidimicrobiia bacterium]